MRTRLMQHLVLLFVAVLLLGSTPIATVQAQEEPSTLYIPTLSTADVLRTGAQVEDTPSEELIVLRARGYSFPPGVNRLEDLQVCKKRTLEEAMAFEEAQRKRIEENGGSDPLDGPALNVGIISCRGDVSQEKPMPGPLGDPLDYLAHPQNDPSDKPQGMSNGDVKSAAVTADTYAWLQYDMYNKRFESITASWIYAAPSLNSGQSWSNYDHFVRAGAGSASQTANCGGLAKLIAGVLRGRAGDTWPNPVANTPELIIFHQGINACTFNQTGYYAQTGEQLMFDVYQSVNDRWGVIAYIDNTFSNYGPYTTGWTNDDASRIFAGNEIFAENGYNFYAIHQTSPSLGYSIVVEPDGSDGSTWSDFDLPSGYTGVTSVTNNSPWAYVYPKVAGLGNYYGELRASLP